MQTKPLYLPKAKNDFAFTVLGGEKLVLLLLALAGLLGIRRYQKRRKPSAGRRKSK